MFWKKKPKREIWTEQMIALYERQIAAREALGTRYICHPSRDLRRVDPLSLLYRGYEVLNVPIPPGGVLQDATHYQDGTPILRLVK